MMMIIIITIMMVMLMMILMEMIIVLIVLHSWGEGGYIRLARDAEAQVCPFFMIT